jgi:potassium-transporting ATPase KdpC subunit
MKALISELRTALLATLVLAFITCAAYPLLITGVAQAAFKDKAHGSLIIDAQNVTRGSTLLGQGFTEAKYFHSRSSAAGANGYDAAGSSGSNLGPTSQKLHDAIKERIAAYRRLNGLSESTTVPADAVTASGSGLDPHISLQNAELQTARVAKARDLDLEKVKVIIAEHTAPATLGIFGDNGVNVLQLNLALDALK